MYNFYYFCYRVERKKMTHIFTLNSNCQYANDSAA